MWNSTALINAVRLRRVLQRVEEVLTQEVVSRGCRVLRTPEHKPGMDVEGPHGWTRRRIGEQTERRREWKRRRENKVRVDREVGYKVVEVDQYQPAVVGQCGCERTQRLLKERVVQES